MKFKPFFILLLLISLFACSTRKTPGLVGINKDTVIKQFFDYTAQDDFFDTANYSHQVLKAQFNNDTVFLRRVLIDIEENKEFLKHGFPESIRRHPVISKMDIDEAYQFNYSASFCDFSFHITISNKTDTIKLNTVIYQSNGQRSVLKLVRENETKLSLQDWEKFEQLISYADYWTLKMYQERVGFDGDYLSVEAITRNRFDHHIVKHQMVKRSFVSKTALYAAYALLIKLAEVKEHCDN